MIEFFLTLTIAVLGKLLADEIKANAPSAARWVVVQCARLLSSHRDRYCEEWLALIADRPSPLGKLICALGCLRAAWCLRRAQRRLSKVLQKLEREVISAIELGAYHVDVTSTSDSDIDGVRVRAPACNTPSVAPKETTTPEFTADTLAWIRFSTLGEEGRRDIQQRIMQRERRRETSKSDTAQGEEGD